MNTQSEKLRKFLSTHFDSMWTSGAGGEYREFPDYDLYARDYLDFAEQSLKAYQATKGSAELLNCISHLKRGMDCQIDTFFSVFNLEKIFTKKNLKFEKKLDFLTACGIFSSRTLVRLNTFRNHMEHRYKIPKVEDIEAYFDLVTAFIAIIEAAIAGLWEREYGIGDENDEGHSEKSFIIGYEKEKPEIVAEWWSWRERDKGEKIFATPDNPFEFAYFMRVLFMLAQVEGMASDGWVKKMLFEENL